MASFTCYHCKKTKPAEAFIRRPNTTTGYSSICYDCIYRKDNPAEMSPYLRQKLDNLAALEVAPPAQPAPTTIPSLLITIDTGECSLDIYRNLTGIAIYAGARGVEIPWGHVRLVAQILNALHNY